MRAHQILTFALLVLAVPCHGYYGYRLRIPNGESVPHPCKANYMWGGVGHMDPKGAGQRNDFGEAFEKAGHKWTEELCRKDSDGDGKTNGQELGDPDCTWQEGEVPERVADISHPGICEPYDQGICAGRDTFVDCSLEEFGDSCEVIKNKDIQTAEFKFEQVKIPATETNYYCQYFDLPQDKDYHIMAYEGLIDNRNVVHHMIMFGCPDEFKDFVGMDKPGPCSMGGEGAGSCNTMIALWTVGIPGTCLGDKMGFKIGTNGYKKVKLEIHYNNPKMVSDYVDATGLKIFYQPMKDGVQDLATFTVGQSYLDIPPGEMRVEAEGSCDSECTKMMLRKPIYVTATSNHMHYMGRMQRTEVIRDGRVIKVLAHDDPFDYDSPVVHTQEVPFEILPGDEVKTTCGYNSMSRKETVNFGQATSDEMCFAFLTVYPADAFPYFKWCSSHGPLTMCDMYLAPRPNIKYGCDYAQFVNLSRPEMTQRYMDLENHCKLDGTCRPGCKEVTDEILKHPCLGEEMNVLVSRYLNNYHEGTKFLAYAHSCDQHDDGKGSEETDCKKDCQHMCSGSGDGDSGGHSDGDSGEWYGNGGGVGPVAAARHGLLAGVMVSLVVMMVSMTTELFC